MDVRTLRPHITKGRTSMIGALLTGLVAGIAGRLLVPDMWSELHGPTLVAVLARPGPDRRAARLSDLHRWPRHRRHRRLRFRRDRRRSHRRRHPAPVRRDVRALQKTIQQELERRSRRHPFGRQNTVARMASRHVASLNAAVASHAGDPAPRPSFGGVRSSRLAVGLRKPRERLVVGRFEFGVRLIVAYDRRGADVRLAPEPAGGLDRDWWSSSAWRCLRRPSMPW